MKAIDLSQKLRKYKSGWVALDKNNKVIAHTSTYPEIETVAKKKKGVVIMSATDNYFGFVTFNG